MGEVVDWGIYTSGQCYQRILCKKIEENDQIIWKAKIEKSKTNPSLNGKEYITMTKDKKTDKIEWFGFDWNMFR